MLSHLSLLVADEPVEFLPLQAQEILPRQQDTTLGGNGAGGVDVVPSHHPDGDPCTLALQDGVRHLGDKDRVRRGSDRQGRALWFGTGYAGSQAAPLPPSLKGFGVRNRHPHVAQLCSHGG